MAEGGQHECMVMFCRDKKSHTTAGHPCSCGAYGHGDFECGKTDEIHKLEEFYSHRLPEHMHCDIEGCKYPWSHTRGAHHCSKCGNNHSSNKCYIQEIEYFMNKFANFSGCERLKDFDYHNFFRSTYLAQSNCFIYFRITEFISLYFIKTIDGIKGLEVPSRTCYESIDLLRQLTYGLKDITQEYNNILNGLEPSEWPSDSWGAPHPDTDIMNEYHIPVQDQMNPEEIMDMILDDYQLPQETLTSMTNDIIDDIETIDLNIISCPLCRTDNSIDKCLEMKGSDNICTICLEANVEVFFSMCGHSIACKSCFSQLVN